MKKKKIKSLQFSTSVVSNLNPESVKGGLSGACTSSINNLQCYFACPESVYAPCG
ncbi:hypothetical protein KORDIASMS9_03510 [Kordia sp. SMS9]|uniref:hypothetical protein n=1 Tax=Kordia sp. SMS9 TaxID=2282170 RepID=UPI000E106016|nr:hypothetical protein [Kordia sp. SMS9]AXG71253.1 hypothetical protein KORDIASMS9_03510 [Kordia sp. SMS9]